MIGLSRLIKKKYYKQKNIILVGPLLVGPPDPLNPALPFCSRVEGRDRQTDRQRDARIDGHRPSFHNNAPPYGDLGLNK